MGVFAPTHLADGLGFITVHDSDRYDKALHVQLCQWEKSASRLVRNAATVELAARAADNWMAR